MVKNMNSLPEKYEPNHLINFLRYGWCLKDVPTYPISKDEQEFVDSVYFKNSPYAVREKPRQSGGTTLLALMMIYYLKQGKRCCFVSKNIGMCRHIRDYVLFEINVQGHNIVSERSPSLNITLEDTITGALSNECVFSTMVPKGNRYDYIFMDFRFNDSDHLNKVFDITIPRLHPGGKVIVNRMP